MKKTILLFILISFISQTNYSAEALDDKDLYTFSAISDDCKMCVLDFLPIASLFSSSCVDKSMANIFSTYKSIFPEKFDQKHKDQQLVLACKKSCNFDVGVLLKLGANVNVNTKYGYPLVAAVKEEAFDIVEKLIANGADINVKVLYGQEQYTLLMYAVMMGYETIVRILVGAGANVHVINEEGLTAFAMASLFQDDTMEEILMGFG